MTKLLFSDSDARMEYGPEEIKEKLNNLVKKYNKNNLDFDDLGDDFDDLGLEDDDFDDSYDEDD